MSGIREAVAVESRHDFLAWLQQAPAGAVCRYHQGDLANDRLRDAELGALAITALAQSEHGTVELLQRRVLATEDRVVTDYYAVKRKVVGRPGGGEW